MRSCARTCPGVAGMTTIAPGIAELYERRYGVRCRVVTNAAPRADLRPRRRASRSGCCTTAAPIL